MPMPITPGGPRASLKTMASSFQDMELRPRHRGDHCSVVDVLSAVLSYLSFSAFHILVVPDIMLEIWGR